MEKEFTKSYAIKRIAELTQQIIDLETKLEEKNEEIEGREKIYSELIKLYNSQVRNYCSPTQDELKRLLNNNYEILFVLRDEFDEKGLALRSCLVNNVILYIRELELKEKI